MKIVVEFGQTIENVEEKRMVVTYHHYYIQGLSLYDLINVSLFVRVFTIILIIKYNYFIDQQVDSAIFAISYHVFSYTQDYE